MRTTVLALILAAGVLGGCDSFEPSDALVPLPNASTDPAALQSDYAWVAVAAVSNGKAYEFPAGGFSTSFTKDGIISGDISANGYVGSYTATADGSLSVGEFVSTLIGESERVERLSGVLTGELQQATRFEIEGRTLQVLSDDGDGLRFELGLPYQSL
jgi:hypothetical protein